MSTVQYFLKNAVFGYSYMTITFELFNALLNMRSASFIVIFLWHMLMYLSTILCMSSRYIILIIQSCAFKSCFSTFWWNYQHQQIFYHYVLNTSQNHYHPTMISTIYHKIHPSCSTHILFSLWSEKHFLNALVIVAPFSMEQSMHICRKRQ